MRGRDETSCKQASRKGRSDAEESDGPFSSRSGKAPGTRGFASLSTAQLELNPNGIRACPLTDG